MKANSITVDGNEAKRITLDGGVLWEGGEKRYAYYFDRSPISTALLGEEVKVGKDWLHSAEIEFMALGYGRIFSRVEVAVGGIRVMLAPNRGAYIPMSNTTNRRHILRINYAENVWKVYLDGEYASEISGGDNDAVLLQWAGNTGYGHANSCPCYIYGFNGRDLEYFPEFTPYNVTRYELDKNGEIIESTATLLNT